MATTAKPWIYPKGSHNVDVGPALQVALESIGKEAQAPLPPKEYYAFNYRSAPDTVDATQKAKVSWDNRDPDKVKLEQPTTQGNDLIFTGTKRRLQPEEWECVLIYDEDTGTFTLERLDSVLDFKYDRAASQSTANRRPHSPLDDSPNSGVTLSSSSPPTPPANQTFDHVQISNINLDLEEGEDTSAPIPVPVKRPSMSGKSLVVPPPRPQQPPAKKESKGKRNRDAYEAKEPTPRPPPKAPTPPPPARNPLRLPMQPKRPPTPPTGARSPNAYGSVGGGKFSFDSDDETPAAPAPKVPAFSKGFTLEVDENPLPAPPARRPFSEGLVEEDGTVDDGLFDAFDDDDEEMGEVGAEDAEAEDDEDDEDEDDDGLGAALEDAFDDTPMATKKPMSLNAYAAAGNADDSEAEAEDDENSDDAWE